MRHDIEEVQLAALKRELLLYGGCLMLFWLIGATSWSGFVVTAIFLAIAAFHLARRAIDAVLETMRKESILRHYAAALIALALFCLLIARATYVLAVVIDSELLTGGGGLVAVAESPL
jgi:hypothetical protein